MGSRARTLQISVWACVRVTLACVWQYRLSSMCTNGDFHLKKWFWHSILNRFFSMSFLIRTLNLCRWADFNTIISNFEADFGMNHVWATLPKGSGGDQECIFFNLYTYQPTFISDTLSYTCRNWKLESGTWRDADAIWTDRREGWNSYVDVT